MGWNAQPKKADQKSAQKKRLASLWSAFCGRANFVKPPFYSYQLTVISEQFWNACGGVNLQPPRPLRVHPALERRGAFWNACGGESMLSGVSVWGIELTIVDGRWTGDTDGEVN